MVNEAKDAKDLDDSTDCLNEDSGSKARKEIVELLKDYTKHRYVKLVNRGNSAIFSALFIAKKINPKPFILVPDQGGWISYKTYPQILGFELRTVKTNRGVIDLIDLGKKIESGAALLLTSFAGYFAEQPMNYIYNICREAGCLLIEDASGAVGDKTLCNGQYADIILASFGKWKVVDHGYGGFISVSDKDLFDKAKESFSMTNFNCDEKELLKKVKGAPERLKHLISFAEQVKQDLDDLDFKIIHKDKRGVNVVVKPLVEHEREDIKKYCEDNNYNFVECPKYIRLEEDAISIELKREHFDTKGKRIKS